MVILISFVPFLSFLFNSCYLSFTVSLMFIFFIIFTLCPLYKWQKFFIFYDDDELGLSPFSFNALYSLQIKHSISIFHYFHFYLSEIVFSSLLSFALPLSLSFLENIKMNLTVFVMSGEKELYRFPSLSGLFIFCEALACEILSNISNPMKK